jgi:site-specific recombinase XerD
MMRQDTYPPIIAFLDELRRQDLAATTIASYQSDLVAFARWFVETTGEAFTPKAVTTTDLLDYKAHLRTVQRRQAATVNRRLAAVRKFFLWAKASGHVTDLPTTAVKGVPAGPRLPKSLAKREVDRLLRAAEQSGNKRNLAILLTLRHTGLRVGELCHLRIQDLTISERKGSVIVRSGKGDKDRTIPLNNDVRLALTAYLAVRPAAGDDHLFIGQRGGPMSCTGLTIASGVRRSLAVPLATTSSRMNADASA